MARLRQHPGWLVLLGGLLVVLPGLFMGLHADDWFHLRSREWGTVLATFAGDWNEGARGEGGFYRPLVRLCFHLDHLLYGLRDWGYHATNGLLFVAVLAGVYTSTVLLCGGPRLAPALTVLLLLALHPLKNEALYWVSGRTDLLASAFLLWAFALALQALRTGRMAWAAGALALLAGGVLAKEVALGGVLLLPLAALLLAGEGVPRKLRLVLLWGPPALGILYLAVRFSALGGLGGYSVPGPPRGVGDFGENGLRMLSALLWPWQADVEGPFRIGLALPGLALALALLMVRPRLQRRLLLCAGGMLLALLPMLPVEPRAGDGARVLLAPLCFLVVGLTVLLWHGERRRSLDPGRLAAVLLLALTLQPTNIRITRDFLAAAGPNRAALADVRQWIEAAPDGMTLVLKEAPLDQHRRILHPGASLLMAAQTWWHEDPGAASEAVTDRETGIFALRLTREGREHLAAHSLQPWMEEALFIRPGRDAPPAKFHLRRVPSVSPEQAFARDMLTLLHEAVPGQVTAWELTGTGWEGGSIVLEAPLDSGEQFLEVGDIHLEKARLFGWMDDAGLAGREASAAELRLPWLREGKLRTARYGIVID